MAFEFVKNNNGYNYPISELIASTGSETYVTGEVLTITAGALTKAGVDTDGTQKFICSEDYVAPASGNRGIYAYRIQPTMQFKIPCQATNASTAIGALVTLYTNATQVTATGLKGCVELVEKVDTGASFIIGRFPTTVGR